MFQLIDIQFRPFLWLSHSIFLICFQLITLQPVLACDVSPIPAEGINNVWYRDNNTNTVIVFVHGVLSDSRKAWWYELCGPKTGYWPEIISNDNHFKDSDIFLGGYYTDLDGGNIGIDQAALKLWNGLRTTQDGRTPVMDRQNILFVTHSTGGIVVRRMLVNRHPDFKEKRVGLLLVASPSGGSQYANYLEALTVLAEHKIGQELQWNHPLLTRLNSDFKSLIKEDKIPMLIGKELVEAHMILPNLGSNQFANLIEALLKAALPRVVEVESAHRFFENPETVGGTDHLSIAKPHGRDHLSHRALATFYEDFKASPKPKCVLPADARVFLKISQKNNNQALLAENPKIASHLPMLTTRRIISTWEKGKKRPNPRTDDGFYVVKFDKPIPCPGDTYKEVFTLAWPGHLNTGNNPTTALCFKRAAGVTGQKRIAGLTCIEGEKCTPHPNDPGMAKACASGRAFRWPFNLVSQAHAANTSNPHWSTLSMESLAVIPASVRPGYTQVTVKTGELKDFNNATHYTFGVKVNGVPLHFDNWPPHSVRTDFSPHEGMYRTFAIENLAFNGETNGYEAIEVEFRLYKNNKHIETLKSQRAYSAFRNLRKPWNKYMETMKADSHVQFDWNGYYIPSQMNERYEVMLLSRRFNKKKQSALEKTRSSLFRVLNKLNGKNLKYRKMKVIGRLRAPRDDNPAYGLTFALKLPSGQVKSVFRKSEAKDICRWVMKMHRKGHRDVINKGAYIYDFVPRNYSTKGDRGKIHAFCKTT